MLAPGESVELTLDMSQAAVAVQRWVQEVMFRGQRVHVAVQSRAYTNPPSFHIVVERWTREVEALQAELAE